MSARSNLKSALKHFWLFIYKTTSLKEGIDIQSTTEGIKRDISFRGHTLWILVCSILIASIGLNVNSVPVIIGAMLISPLMGPILGIGLAVGTYDWETLLKSLKNFGIAIIISLLTATIYFLVSPIREAQSELLARTKPTFLDVLIAIFGGLAGIIAGSRKEKTNVVPGVAIATALMPPLCTAGYGLATAQFRFFIGAFYLFFINSVFISISTYIIVRYLHFPQMNFVNPQRSKRIHRYMLIFVIIVMLPSAVIFTDVIKESKFMISANEYISNNLLFEGTEIINQKITYNDTLSYIDIYVIGDEISPGQIKELNNKIEDYGLCKKGSFWKTGHFAVTNNTLLRVHQAKDNTEAVIESKLNLFGADVTEKLRQGFYEEFIRKNEKIIEDKNREIDSLQTALHQLEAGDSIPFSNIEREIKVLYPKVEKIAFARSVESDLDSLRDTIPTFLVKWNRKAYRRQKQQESKQIEEWLRAKLNVDTLRVIEY